MLSTNRKKDILVVLCLCFQLMPRLGSICLLHEANDLGPCSLRSGSYAFRLLELR